MLNQPKRKPSKPSWPSYLQRRETRETFGVKNYWTDIQRAKNGKTILSASEFI